MKYIDLRSDTVTKPSLEMKKAMMNAEVGDDVYGEDPTTNLLQNKVSKMFGKDAALFVPSGTMGNEICIKLHTQPGDEIIVDEDSHIFVYETGAPALLAGIQMMPIKSNRGILTAEQISDAVRGDAYYLPKTRLICLENTHGRSGGTIFPINEIKRIRNISKLKKIPVHLDGARLWNASVATGISLKEYGKYFDTISVCFSKGLGAPIGSIIIGDNIHIELARRYRKIFGGGMRQVGILAASALYAIENNIDRLKEDHKKALMFAEALSKFKQLKIDIKTVQTNMVFIDIQKTGKTQKEVLYLLQKNGVLLTPERDSLLRAVTHLNVSFDDMQTSIKVFKKLFI